MLRLRFLLATAFACLSTLGVQGQSVLNVSADFASIQDAIDAANSGDTLVMSAGTFSPDTTIELNKSGLVLRGAGAEETTIDIGGFNAWGIDISADSVMCQNFSIQGNAATNQQYAIHTTPGIAYARVLGVTVTGNHLTGVDFNGVSGGVIRDVTSTGAASGFGISISSCENLIVRDITTSGNAWGNVGVFPAHTDYQTVIEAPHNIRFLDGLDLEGGIITVQNGALASGGTWDPVISTTDNTDALYAAQAGVRVPEAMHYTAQATRFDGLDNRAVGTPEDVLALMALIEGLTVADLNPAVPGGDTIPAFGQQTFTDLEAGTTTDYIPGCMDNASCSFDTTATISDAAACTYPAETYLDCAGECLLDADMDDQCDAIDNCTDTEACNYDSPDNGVCQYTDDCGICGGDGIAEGDCDCDGNQLDALGVCGGDCASDSDMDMNCDDVDQCTDTLACNYTDPTATQCLYADVCGVCGGSNEGDTDGDGVCDTFDLCIDMTACNVMNPFALECLYTDSCGVCGGDGPDLTFQLDEVYAYDEADSGDVSSNAAMPLQLPWMGAGSYRLSGEAVNFQQINADPEYFTINIPAGYALTGIQLLEYDQSSFAAANDSISLPFGNGGFMGVGPGDTLPVINSPDDFYAAAMALDGGALVGVNPGSQPGDDLLGDLGQAFNFYGLVMGGFDGPLGEGSWTFMFKEGNTMSGTEDAYVSWSFSLEVSEVGENAYLAIYDCEGGCLTDSNENGICDELEVAGCMDPNALNYDASATLSATCEYFSAGCVPVFDPAIADTVFVSCVDELPMEAPEQFAYDPCTAGNPQVDVLTSMMDIDTVTACAQFVTYRYVALNIAYGLIGVEFQTYAVKDETGPVISSIPEDLVIACTDDSTAYGMVEAQDSCHDLMDITYSVDSTYVDSLLPICPGNFNLIRTVTASDVCGNESSASYTISVRDLVPPVLGNVPANDSLSCEAAIPADLPLHQDDCGQSTLDVSMTTLPGTCPENYTLIRTFTAEDECGNASSAIQEVVFTDTVAPTILTTPADLVLACEDMVADSAITAEDNCSELTLAWMDSTVMGDCPQEYTILRTHTASDACGNSSAHLQTIDVVDEVAPEFTDLEAFVSATCSDALSAFAAAEDTCSAVTLSFATFSAYGSSVPGQQIRLYTATDECGNATEGIQLVSFSDAADCSGCTNETAQNYDASALLNDGSCDFGGIYTQGGDCNVDTDEDGVCDQLEIVGCTDTVACNFLDYATDSDSLLCVYPDDPERDCNGNCLEDEDNDGVCDGNEVAGCRDIMACNFNFFATDSDPSLCNYGCQGCTYPDATNYDGDADVDDGSCEFDLEAAGPTCDGDANGDGQVSITDLLDVLDAFGTICE